MDLFLADFMPHGVCYRWQPGLLWLHALSDGLTALAYFLIPAALVRLGRRRPDLNFGGVFWLFAAFVAACGTAHALEIVAIWQGIYWTTGVAKAVTAAVSLPTAFVLWRMVPRVAEQPTMRELRREVRRRRKAEAQLREINRRLSELLDTYSRAGLETLAERLEEQVERLRNRRP